MPNENRGEIEIILGGETKTLRPSFEAMAEMESRSGFGVIGLANRVAKNNISVLDIVSIIYGGIKGSGDKMSFEVVKELVVRDGLMTHVPHASMFLMNCLKGEERPEKKLKAAK